MTDRSTPEWLIDIAERAIRRGAQSVSLINASESEVPAPIGWLLWITDKDDATTLTDASVGSSPQDEPAWIADATEVPVIDRLLDLFLTGVRGGWGMTYERNYIEAGSLARLASIRGKVGLGHKLQAVAYNRSLPPESDESFSTEYTLHEREGNPKDRTGYRILGYKDGQHGPTDFDEIVAILRQEAPHRARVAYYDEETDEWSL